MLLAVTVRIRGLPLSFSVKREWELTGALVLKNNQISKLKEIDKNGKEWMAAFTVLYKKLKSMLRLYCFRKKMFDFFSWICPPLSLLFQNILTSLRTIQRTQMSTTVQ